MFARALPLSLLAASILSLPATAADDEQVRDEQILRDAGQAWDGPALLDYFRKRSVSEEKRQKILALIRKTGDESFKVRRQAAQELDGFGISAIGLLKQAQRDRDPEVAHAAGVVLARIEKVPSNLLTAATARMLGRVKPAGALETLLAYLPLADDEMAAEAIGWALSQLAMRDGQPAPPLLAALNDPLPVRRAAAAEALVQAKASTAFPQVRKLLRDPDDDVRLATALALVTAAKDKEAVPELIALLADVPQEKGMRLEETLYSIAGDQAPKVSLIGDAASRIQCRDAWSEWWTKNKERVDLSKLGVEPRPFGYTLVLQMDLTGQGGRVIEYAPDGKTIRWQVNGLQLPLDAQVLPHSQHVLLAEHNANMVAERDFQGKIHWQQAVIQPLACQRLPNGNTFIAARDQLLEVDMRGQKVFAFNRGQNDIVAGRKGSDGQYVYATQLGKITRIDSKGNEVRSFTANRMYHYADIQLLPKNRVLLTQMASVAEYDELTGKQVWQASTGRMPVSVTRLPNGNTLAASASTRAIQEFDRDGTEVRKETLPDASPWRVLKR